MNLRESMWLKELMAFGEGLACTENTGLSFMVQSPVPNVELSWIVRGTVLICFNASLQVLQVRAGQEARVLQAGLEIRAPRVALEVLEALDLLDHQVTVTRTPA